MIINSVNILAQEGITEQEIQVIIADEIERYKAKGKEIAKIELTIEHNEIVVTSVACSPIRRVRRITGYLSEQDNFNQGKRAELGDRKVHIG